MRLRKPKTCGKCTFYNKCKVDLPKMDGLGDLDPKTPSCSMIKECWNEIKGGCSSDD